MGPMGLLASYFAGWSVNHFKIKNLIIFGMLLSMISPIPAAVMTLDTSFWASIFPSSILGVVGISIVYVSPGREQVETKHDATFELTRVFLLSSPRTSSQSR